MPDGATLEDFEDHLGSLVWVRGSRVDLVHERNAVQRLLEDHTDRLRFDILTDLCRRPAPGFKPESQNGRLASKDDRYVDIEQVSVMTSKECDLRRDTQRSGKLRQVHLVTAAGLIPSHDRSGRTGGLLDIDDRKATGFEDASDRLLARPGRPGKGDQHSLAKERRGLVISCDVSDETLKR